MSGQASWIAVDWGTSNLRLWGMGDDGQPVFTEESGKGMGKLTREQFPGVLLEILTPHAGAIASSARVVICGMAGARQGWVEAPYVETPASLASLADKSIPVQAGRFEGNILPGIAQRMEGSEDVMRGEETQLLGLLRLRPGFEGLAILPGTHSKWAEIKGGSVVRFVTAMTGELFELLSKHSVLRHALGAEPARAPDEEGVSAGLRAGLEEPQLLTGLLFRTRAASLLSGRSPEWCVGYLSGLLVGAEIGGRRNLLGAGPVPLIGSSRLNRLYGAALKFAGVASLPIDAADATLAGLTEARGHLV